MTNPQEFVKKVESLLKEMISTGSLDMPLLPEVAMQVLNQTSDESSNASNISSLIHRDPVLAAQVLKIANSVAFRGNTDIVSLQQAVTRLGLNLMREITLSVSLHDKVFNVPGHKEDVSILWHHAVASGAYSKEIARLKRLNIESAYLCGLLHEIGKPLILQTVAQLMEQHHITLLQHEVFQILDQFHMMIGEQLVTQWKFPEQVKSAISFYHSPLDSDAFKDEAMITSLADLLATHHMHPSPESEQHIRSHTIIQHLNFYPDHMDTLFEKRDTVQNIMESMSI